MPVTIKEIANMANVSTATVSMVINNKPGISSSTRKRVLSIVESYGYNVSPLKNSLMKRNGTIQLTIYKKTVIRNRGHR
jgi:LacI family transcriptional regulator